MLHLYSSGEEIAPEVLTVGEMAEVERAAARAGITGERLMEAAGRAVAETVAEEAPEGPVVVLAGPGNNGGDGFVAARHLARRGRNVRVALLGDAAALQGDAAAMADRWKRRLEPFAPAVLEGAAVVVDAVFGTGLARPLEGRAAEVLAAAGGVDGLRVAVDIPSGVAGDTGAVDGASFRADVTVAFGRFKPGHLLLPGRDAAGELVLADIGIPDSALEEVSPTLFLNGPPVWLAGLPDPVPSGHKYDRGHVVVAGGPAGRAGAAWLAATAALRSGAGLVTIATPPDALAAYAGEPRAVMLEPAARPLRFARLLRDPRVRAVVLGPGNGVGRATRARVSAASGGGRRVVLDADALTSFAGRTGRLGRLCRRCEVAVLTPHEGEMARLFPDLAGMVKTDAARAAAERTGAVVVLKGPDTVVAEPEGWTAINANAPSGLATAGSGDVLAGVIGGLLAQEADGFSAAAAGVWLHGEAGQRAGPGLIADDLPGAVPDALAGLWEDVLEHVMDGAEEDDGEE